MSPFLHASSRWLSCATFVKRVLNLAHSILGGRRDPVSLSLRARESRKFYMTFTSILFSFSCTEHCLDNVCGVDILATF
jgi:hypothetical protein